MAGRSDPLRSSRCSMSRTARAPRSGACSPSCSQSWNNPNSLLTNEVAIQSYEEHLALSLLLGLPHSHSERYCDSELAAAPANVKRAEEFMRANAREPLTIEAIANAGGAAFALLQLAFRSFRGTTPMASLQRIRLEAARVGDIALRSGAVADQDRRRARFQQSEPVCAAVPADLWRLPFRGARCRAEVPGRVTLRRPTARLASRRQK